MRRERESREGKSRDKTQSLPLILLKTNCSRVNILSYSHEKKCVCGLTAVIFKLLHPS